MHDMIMSLVYMGSGGGQGGGAGIVHMLELRIIPTFTVNSVIGYSSMVGQGLGSYIIVSSVENTSMLAGWGWSIYGAICLDFYDFTYTWYIYLNTHSTILTRQCSLVVGVYI